MPRTARASVGNICYHVINRGNNRAEVFHKSTDYVRFTDMLGEAVQRLPMRVLSWCLMPNNFHLVLWPYADGDLSRWMQWLMTSHVRRYHRHYDSSGHIWQGRFKAFPIQQDEHYLTVLRYVEANALRAQLVDRAQEWPFSSLAALQHPEAYPFLAKGPLKHPTNWLSLVNRNQAPGDLDQIQTCVNRQRPFGSKHWISRVAKTLGLEYTLRPRGRPRKAKIK